MLEQHPSRQLADSGAGSVGQTLDGEQELVLLWL
jgi:hypothetical protein